MTARRVLILGGRAPAALDHARRFAHQGWTVFVGDSIPCRISGASRAVTATVPLASPRDAPARFVDDLCRAVAEHRIDLLMPTCEEVFYLSRWRHRLPAAVRVLADDFALLREMHSKWRFLQLADGCGATVPASARVRSSGEARDWAAGRPVVLKPEFSRFGVHVRLHPHGIPKDAPPLADLGDWVVQAFAPGTEYASYSIADRGRLLAHSLYRPAHRLSRSSSFHFAPARIDAIREFVAAFVHKTGFSGQLSFDWIQAADGRVTVLECNPRATSGVHLFGLDAPLPAALDGTLAEPVEADADAPRMIAAVMASAGFAGALRHGRVADWWHDFVAARDCIAVPGDRAPFPGALRDLLSYARIAMQQRCNLREAATRDIEWDGQDLPDV